ncbi:hypothetical protein [Streptomyces sp. NEAU-W12]|uniref:hypothetical protein n=1 Tax=Streptomyces sp. NEAU-W12 TaxID=2994668 RepID=UPI00224ADDCC|nr:hypothetical protein [Streptomyces sp. NEAU-W12]MCX2927362.1 hypothetical protein [Streptomyces sp. NEAU-W12]
MITHSDEGPDFDPDDPLAVILRPPSEHLGPPPGRYQAIRRGAARRKLLRGAAGAAVTCGVAALVVLPLRLSTSGAPGPSTPPMAPPPPATSPATVPTPSTVPTRAPDPAPSTAQEAVRPTPVPQTPTTAPTSLPAPADATPRAPTGSSTRTAPPTTEPPPLRPDDTAAPSAGTRR